MHWKAVTAICLAVVLAGCTESQDVPEEPDQDVDPWPGTSSPAPTTPPVAEPNIPNVANEMQWSDCLGVYTEFYWPSPLNPAPAFDGWAERDPPPPVPTEIRHLVFECQRFGFRTLERGPIQFLVEVTNDRRPPDACLAMEPEADVLNFISIWTSDAEVAQTLASEGMPAGVAEFRFSVETGTPIHFHGEWTVDGSQSYLDAYQESADSATLFGASPWRLFWHNGQGVSSVEFGHQVKATGTPPERLVTGELAAPLTMAGPYASTGYHFSGGDFGGAITRFGDVACTTPLSSQ